MILTFLLSGSYLTMKMAHGLGWGPLVLPSLRGMRGRRGEGESGRWGSGAEGESGEVSVPVGELDEGEGEGWQGSG